MKKDDSSRSWNFINQNWMSCKIVYGIPECLAGNSNLYTAFTLAVPPVTVASLYTKFLQPTMFVRMCSYYSPSNSSVVAPKATM